MGDNILCLQQGEFTFDLSFTPKFSSNPAQPGEGNHGRVFSTDLSEEHLKKI